jgi:hypothetical protein
MNHHLEKKDTLAVLVSIRGWTALGRHRRREQRRNCEIELYEIPHDTIQRHSLQRARDLSWCSVEAFRFILILWRSGFL